MTMATVAEAKRRLSATGPCSTVDRAIIEKQATESLGPNKNQSPNSTDNEEDGSPSSPSTNRNGLPVISESENDGLDSDDNAAEDREQRYEDLWKELAIKSGYLMKKGERRHAWKKRYFVLRPKRFGYYKDNREYKLLRDIPLMDVRTCAEVQVKRHDHVFGIVTAQRTYYVQARDQNDLNDWVVKIDQASKAVRRAKEEEVSSSVTEEDPSTPQGAQGGLSRSQTATQPIAMANTRSNNQFQPEQPASLVSSMTVSSSSTNAFSPVSDPLPSSFTSVNSSNAMHSSGYLSPSPTYHVPPNSYAAPEMGSNSQHPPQPSPILLSNVNASLAKLAPSSPPASVPPFYANSPPLASPTRERGTSISSTSNKQRPLPQRKPSVGNMSSSEDDDDDFDMPASPTSPISPHHIPGSHSGYPLGSPTQYRHPESDKTVMSGYLTKQGKRKNWRKRWFSLSSTRLSYSKSHMDQKVHHQIPLTRILDVMEYEAPIQSSGLRARAQSNNERSNVQQENTSQYMDPMAKKAYEHCFQIITPKRTFKLCATDEESEIKWISAIRVLLAATRRSNPISTTPISVPPILSMPPAITRRETDIPTQKITLSMLPMQHRHSFAAPPLALADNRQVNSNNLPSIEGKLEEAQPIFLSQGRQRSATQIGKA